MEQDASSNVVAVFDFDGTITRRDTLRMFLRRAGGARRYILAASRSAPILLAALVFGGGFRDRAKVAMLRRVLSGRTDADVLAHADELAMEIIANELRNDVCERLRWHQSMGHEAFIVSASFDPYVRRVANYLGVVRVVATRWQVDADGRLTGRLDGPNVRGEAKVDAVASQLGGRSVFLYAYGDSRGDRSLLETADVAVWVRGRQIERAPKLGRPA